MALVPRAFVGSGEIYASVMPLWLCKAQRRLQCFCWQGSRVCAELHRVHAGECRAMQRRGAPRCGVVHDAVAWCAAMGTRPVDHAIATIGGAAALILRPARLIQSLRRKAESTLRQAVGSLIRPAPLRYR
ncbi:hypothetical protein LMG28138_02613 [Pararobbsia alpina]|uniref:Uncharacterized protein n=1 Tax=Pararobbsia alpina TaxID=621374 RepID=A0A6S7BH74_9BURK|nr:hypothetical protein LMG28138_02613 [Pararobbsia alpina]